MKKVLCLLFAIIMLLGIFPLTLFAAEETVNNFDNSDITKDFGNSNFFEVFELNRLAPENALYFAEYAYSGDNYGLYVYLYNATNSEIKVKDESNSVFLSVTLDDSGRPVNFENYKLVFCSKTDDNKVYKFKIDKSGTEKIRKAVSSEKRVYSVSMADFVFGDKLGAVEYGKTLTFTGYAKGCSAESSSASTLSVSAVKFETLYLENTHTSYRYKSSSTVGEYCDIQSVAFNIPKDYLTRYGELYKVKSQWREALTTPILVLDNVDMVLEFQKQLRKNVSEDFPYTVFWLPTDVKETTYYSFVYGRYPAGQKFLGLYNWVLISDDFASSYNLLATKKYKKLNYCFFAEDVLTENKTVVSSQELIKYLNSCNWKKSMFEKVSEMQTREFFADDFETTKKYTPAGFWKKLFGSGFDESSFSYDAFVKVDDSDIDLSNESFAKKYLVAECDVDSIKARMQEKNFAGDDVSDTYLLRFAVTEYTAYDNNRVAVVNDNCILDALNEKGSIFTGWSEPIVHALVAQVTAIKDFQTTEITFKKDDTYTSLAVISEPTNYVAGVTVPETPKIEFPKMDSQLKKILIILAIIVVLIVAFPVFSFVVKIIVTVVKGIFKVASIPFKNRRKKK